MSNITLLEGKPSQSQHTVLHFWIEVSGTEVYFKAGIPGRADQNLAILSLKTTPATLTVKRLCVPSMCTAFGIGMKQAVAVVIEDELDQQ